MRPILVLLVLATATLAGCAEGEEEAPPTSSPVATPGTSTPTTPGSGEAATCTSTTASGTTATEPTWVLETSMGTIRLTLFCDKTPITAQNIVKLTEEGYFDGTKFHRVIKGFMDQGGDPLTKDDSQASRWGTGGPGYDIEDEFYCADGTVDKAMDNPQYDGRPLRPGGAHKACNGALGLKHDTAGALSMANAGPNSGGSQFFITVGPQPSLDGAHPVFGHTADQASLDTVLAINNECPCPGDRPDPPIVVNRATIDWS